MPFKDPALRKKLKNAYSKRTRRKKNTFCRKVKKGKYVKPGTAFEENYLICHTFKKRFVLRSDNKKLKELCRLAEIKIPDKKHNYKERRRKKHRIFKPCWVCTKDAFYPHHIIQIQNGGFDSGINRISICQECHETIHPWMKG